MDKKQETKKLDSEKLISGTKTGWVCPRCGRINSPLKLTCDCINYDLYNPYIYPDYLYYFPYPRYWAVTWTSA